MTVKLDIPALLPCPFCGGPAEESNGHSFMTSFYEQIHCGNCRFNLKRQTRAEVAAAWNTRAPTTALEIGRAMGREEAAKVCEQYERLSKNHPVAAEAARDIIGAIRSTAHAVDLEGLATASLMAELESVLADINNGAEPEPSDVRDLLHGYKRLLSSLGLHA